MKPLFAIIVVAVLAAPAGAAQCIARAEQHPVALIELYTSEGCSSCPPADRWLSHLGAQTTAVVPLALHVDYWDYIGWKDRYAMAQFDARQRDEVRRGGSQVVYTPQVMLDGRDFPNWYDAAAFAQALRAEAQRPLRASLVLRADKDAVGWTAQLSGKVMRPRRNAQVYLALYENGLSSDVRAGENRGVRLHHDFVVRRWIGPLPVAADGRIAVEQTFAARPDVDFAHAGVAAFVQDADTGEILQAVALPLCHSPPADTP